MYYNIRTMGRKKFIFEDVKEYIENTKYTLLSEEYINNRSILKILSI